MQLGDLFLPYPPYPGTIDGVGAGLRRLVGDEQRLGHQLPRVAERRGAAVVRDRLGAAGRPRALAIETAAALTQPLVAVLGATRDPPAASICDVEAPGVEVVLLAPAEDGFVVHLQSYADEPVAVGVAGARITVDPGDYVTVPFEHA